MITQDVVKLFLFVCIAEVSSYTQESMIRHEVDVGKNLTIPCISQNLEQEDDQSRRVLMWIREGRQDRQSSGMTVLPNGTLVLSNLSRDDSGVYICMEDGIEQDAESFATSLTRVLVQVRAAPPPLSNVIVKPSSALVTLFWDVSNDTGGYPIDFFSARYRLQEPPPPLPHTQHSPHHWQWVEPKRIGSTVRIIDVYQLKPNSSYVFEMWATNHLGPGQKTEIVTHTGDNPAEIEMVRHMLEGVETFDTRVWVAAVAVVMGTLLMLALGTCYLLYRECHLPSMNLDEHEFMELVPHIILNPGFHDEDDLLERDENCNDRNIVHINNNSVMRPYRI